MVGEERGEEAREQQVVDQEVDGWYTDEEMQLLAETARLAPTTGDFAEVGVYRGRSARVLDKMRTSQALILFDTFAMETASVRHWPNGKRVWHCFEDVLDWDPVPIALLHQDADHTYQVVLDHLEHLGPSVVKGGFICLHDFEDPTYPDVKRAWEIYSENEDFQPYGRRGHLAVFRRTK